MKKEVWMVAILVLVATISAGLLGFVNVTTRPIIEKNELRKLRESVLDSIKVDYNQDNLEDKFTSEIKTKTIDGKEIFFRYNDEGKLTAVAFEVTGSGFQGPISGLISLKPNLETIIGLEMLSQQETPGLGARITEEWFLKQFNGKKIKPELKIVKNPGDAINKVDAITGATRTSKAIQGLINDDVKHVRNKILTDKVMEGFRNE